MTGILADVNIQGHVDYLFHLLTSDAWVEFWQALGIRYVTFRDASGGRTTRTRWCCRKKIRDQRCGMRARRI